MKLLDKDGLTYYTGKIKNELTDYVKNTDYATGSKGGVVTVSGNYGTQINPNNGLITTPTISYNNYLSSNNATFIGKGTLENVITGKELVNKTYVDNIVGNIESLLAEV